MSKRRALALVVLTYLTLDVADPMMPGVVQFVDGALQIVQADLSRSLVQEAPLVATHTRTSPLVDIAKPAKRCPVVRCAMTELRRPFFLPPAFRSRPPEPASVEDD